MKALKKALLTLTFAFGSLTLMAQPQQGGRPDQNATPEERAEKQVEMMTKQLDLSKDQQKKVYDIVLKFSEEQKAQQGEKGGQQQGSREEMQKAMKALDTKIQEVLTPAQKKTYAEMQEKRGQGRGQGGQGGGRR